MSESFCGTIIDSHPRGFFFIQPDNSRQQIFGHARDVIGRLALKAGDRVSFSTEPDPKGPRAVHVLLLDVQS
jgi:cold shock CspA family protein